MTLGWTALRSTARLVVAVVVVATGPALGGAAAGARETQAPSPPEVEVLDAGSDPREALRYAPAVGASETSTMTMRFDVDQSGVSDLSLKPPPIRATIVFTLLDVTPEGQLHVTVTYPSFEVLKRKGTSAAERRELEDGLASLAGLSGEYTMTTQGAVLESRLDIPPGLDPAIAQTLEQLSNQLGLLQAPFPEPPVGIGARWRSMTSLTSSGITIRQDAEYTLKNRTGAILELGVRGRQSARPQTIESPDVPAGAEVRLTKFTTTLRGTVTSNLASVLGSEGRLRASGDQTFDVREDDERGRLRQHFDFDMSLEPA